MLKRSHGARKSLLFCTPPSALFGPEGGKVLDIYFILPLRAGYTSLQFASFFFFFFVFFLLPTNHQRRREQESCLFPYPFCLSLLSIFLLVNTSIIALASTQGAHMSEKVYNVVVLPGDGIGE